MVSRISTVPVGVRGLSVLVDGTLGVAHGLRCAQPCVAYDGAVALRLSEPNSTAERASSDAMIERGRTFPTSP
ncbi:MAG: hypothetical protein NVS3B26_30170 [Mycobacteriales bacterium]